MRSSENKSVYDPASKRALVIGASSDIGSALCNDWIAKNWEVAGTYRTESKTVKLLNAKMSALVQCDLRNSKSVENVCAELNKAMPKWDVLVLGPGLQEPAGLFHECDFDEWVESVEVNFTSQLRFLHFLLASRSPKCMSGPTVLFFAGGGVNSAPANYSAYTVSKIALIKMVELLAVEITDAKFLIVGPGWVKTKIHHSILNAGERAGASYERTLEMFKNGTFTPMEKVVECCNALISGPREILTGRNFSVAFDRWDDPNLLELLQKHPEMYKLRRYGNTFLSTD
jgi:NAD(P)-dependent dehydrogenase (short-subunit alcohol dehydrogenase family)